MVHRHGQAARRRHDAALARAGGDRRDAIRAGSRATTASRGMIENRPDWVVSRQRAWGVPIAVFVREGGRPARSCKDDGGQCRASSRPSSAEGADAWYEPGAAARFLGNARQRRLTKVEDILDVWFDSGSTHAFTLEDRSISGPCRHPPQGRWRRGTVCISKARTSIAAGSSPRCWRAAARAGARPSRRADARLRAGREGPEDVEVAGQRHRAAGGDGALRRRHPAPVGGGLGLFRRPAHRPGNPEDLEETYRKLRNTLRWLLGTLAHFERGASVAHAEMPELERWCCTGSPSSARRCKQAYATYDYKRVVATLSAFMTSDLSAFYFDIRKDALYCDPASSTKRRAALTVIDHLFRAVRPGSRRSSSSPPKRRGRRASVTRHRSISSPSPSPIDLARRRACGEMGEGASGCAASSPARWRSSAPRSASARRSKRRRPSIIADAETLALLGTVDFDEVCIVSAIDLEAGAGPAGAFRLDGIDGRCRRS